MGATEIQSRTFESWLHGAKSQPMPLTSLGMEFHFLRSLLLYLQCGNDNLPAEGNSGGLSVMHVRCLVLVSAQNELSTLLKAE